MHELTDEMLKIASKLAYKYGPSEKNLVYVVHVDRTAIEPKASYRDRLANQKLEEICKQNGLPYSVDNFFSLGYDDVSFEVPSETTARQVVDKLNTVLPKSNNPGGYGYGTAFPAQAQAYLANDEDKEDLSDVAEWNYPKSDL